MSRSPVRAVLAAALVLCASRAVAADPPCHAAPAAAAPAEASSAEARPADADGAEAQVRLADVPLLDADARPVRFREDVVGDRIVVVDFVFTTCTTVCPVISSIFSQLQGDLGERLGRDVRLVSVTIDPARDTPARLKAYAQRHHAGAGWTWVTGGEGNVNALLKGMGAYTPRFADHAPFVLVGDGRTGRWSRFNGFPDRKRIVAEVERLAGARAAAGAPARGDPEARARAYFPDVPLVTHEGTPIRFYSDVLRPRVVVVDFIFTRCEGACPLLTQKLNQVRELVGDLLGKEIAFLSLSVDPEFDTPVELRRFAEKHRAIAPGWIWATGTRADVDLVLSKLGQYSAEIEDHSTAMIAGNARTNHWTKLHPSAPAAAIADSLRRLVAEQSAARTAADG